MAESPFVGKLNVHVLWGRDFYEGEPGETDKAASPYVVLKYANGKKKVKTAVVRNDPEPYFDTQVAFDLAAGDTQVMSMQVWDRRRLRDKFLGSAAIDLRRIISPWGVEEWFTLGPRPDKPDEPARGALYLSVSFSKFVVCVERAAGLTPPGPSRPDAGPLRAVSPVGNASMGSLPDATTTAAADAAAASELGSGPAGSPAGSDGGSPGGARRAPSPLAYGANASAPELPLGSAGSSAARSSYALVRYGSDKGKSSVVAGTLNPDYGATFHFCYAVGHPFVEVEIYGKGKLTDTFLGRVVLFLNDYKSGEIDSSWYNLLPRSPNHPVSGAVLLTVQAFNVPQDLIIQYQPLPESVAGDDVLFEDAPHAHHTANARSGALEPSDGSGAVTSASDGDPLNVSSVGCLLPGSVSDTSFATTHPGLWSLDDIHAWLFSLGMERFFQAFVDHEVDGESLTHMSTLELARGLSIPMGPAKKFFLSIQNAKVEYAARVQTHAALRSAVNPTGSLLSPRKTLLIEDGTSASSSRLAPSDSIRALAQTQADSDSDSGSGSGSGSGSLFFDTSSDDGTPAAAAAAPAAAAGPGSGSDADDKEGESSSSFWSSSDNEGDVDPDADPDVDDSLALPDAHVPVVGAVALNVVSGRDLVDPSKIRESKASTYVVIRHGSTKFKSPVAAGTYTPEFGARTWVPLVPPKDAGPQTITIDVYRSRTLSSKLLGTVTLNVDDLPNDGSIFDQWLDVVPPGAAAGASSEPADDLDIDPDAADDSDSDDDDGSRASGTGSHGRASPAATRTTGSLCVHAVLSQLQVEVQSGRGFTHSAPVRASVSLAYGSVSVDIPSVTAKQAQALIEWGGPPKTLVFEAAASYLALHVWDKSSRLSSTHLGMVYIPLERFADNLTHVGWYSLVRRKDSDSAIDPDLTQVLVSLRVVALPPFLMQNKTLVDPSEVSIHDFTPIDSDNELSDPGDDPADDAAINAAATAAAAALGLKSSPPLQPQRSSSSSSLPPRHRSSSGHRRRHRSSSSRRKRKQRTFWDW